MKTAVKLIFDDSNRDWMNDEMANEVFVASEIRYIQHMYKTQGYVYLKDVYRWLGFNHNLAPIYMGWDFNKGHELKINFERNFETSKIEITLNPYDISKDQ